jgi:hypothetical protein
VLLVLDLARLSGFTRSRSSAQCCARQGTAWWPLLLGICRTHRMIGGGHGNASERTTGLAQTGEKPRRVPYFGRKAQIVPCDLISCLSRPRALFKCPRSRSVSLCGLCEDQCDDVGTYWRWKRANVSMGKTSIG